MEIMQQWKSTLRRFIFLMRLPLSMKIRFRHLILCWASGWTARTVLDVDNGGRVLIHWAGYTRYFDAWLDALEGRKPEGERPLDRRHPVLKSNFPKQQHPKHDLQKDADLACLCVSQPRLVWGRNGGKKLLLQRRGETLSFSNPIFLLAG